MLFCTIFLHWFYFVQLQALKLVATPENTKRQFLRSLKIPDYLKSACSKHWRSMLRVFFLSHPWLHIEERKIYMTLSLDQDLLPNKVPTPKRNIPGMKKYGLICSYIREGQKFREKDFTWFLNRSLHCKSHKNIVYMIKWFSAAN